MQQLWLNSSATVSSIRIFEPIQSGNVCVQVASAYAYFEAPSVATKAPR
jgi:hypothetical protein